MAVTVDIPDHDRLSHDLPPMDGGIRIGDSELSAEVVDREESVVEETFGSHRKVPIIDWVGNQDGSRIVRHSESMSQPPRSAGLRSARRDCSGIAGYPVDRDRDAELPPGVLRSDAVPAPCEVRPR